MASCRLLPALGGACLWLAAACAQLDAPEPRPADAAPGRPAPLRVAAAVVDAGRSGPVMGRHGAPVTPPVQGLADEAAARRRALAALVGEGVVWLDAAPADELDRFFQDDDFYYLAGVELPDVSLAIVIGGGAILDEVLFLPEHDPVFEVWNGPRLAPGPQAEEATGVRRTAPLAGRQAWADGLADVTVYAADEDLSVTLPGDVTLNSSSLAGGHAAPGWTSALRLIKSPYEVACLRNAIDITCNAFHDALWEVRPGAWEYQVQAAIEGGFMHRGSERPGFSSICGSGPNTVTLHYDRNRRQMRDGDLIVIDVGAKYRYYCADVTRTLPVSGRFTPRQREIYELVLAAQTAAAEAARPGMTMRELDAIARGMIADAGYGPHFKHGLGHWIGLDVHDVGGRAPIEVDSLFTIEPGIYLADEGLGVRIEDDYIMTPHGAERLSVGFPSDPDAIEELMARLR